MDDKIELISDGDGLAVIGDPVVVDRFLASEGLPSKDLRLKRLLSIGAAAAQAASEIAANSGRWVKLTEESAQLLKKYDLMKGSAEGVSRAVLTDKGKIKGLLQLTRGSVLTNPALLSGAAGLMAQLAIQQTMDEITDYLAIIDEKVDNVLRAQTDAVVADMIGVSLTIDEALAIRGQVGRVSEVTWSKVQATPTTIARTQAYALRQLDALADKMEGKTNIGDLAKTSEEAKSTVQEWLVVLARCFQLQDAIAVLELDRVLDTSPEELDQHRLAIRAARQNRLELISRTTERLLARMNSAAGTANTKVLLNPAASPALVRSSNHVAAAVVDFHGRLGIDGGRHSLEARPWTEAAGEVKGRVLETGAVGVDAAWHLGKKNLDRARSMMGGIADRTRRQRGEE